MAFGAYGSFTEFPVHGKYTLSELTFIIGIFWRWNRDYKFRASIKESFERLLKQYQNELKAEQIRELTVKKKIEDLKSEIARISNNLQAVENIKERE